ncbi:butyrophilin-like protein 8 [Morone saxatilis]|uniref:butyrophilin-like protein 8 n=1 Tax=Morone saxatilis TaxID=34816 RepID=UPI0015E1E946|nr:butyrophilin-like protein 8 [Morone saxatilis]
MGIMEENVGFIIVLLTHAAVASADPEVLCSSKPVTAALGEDATLQCLLRPPQDATNMTVEWHHEYLNLTVHLYEDRKDNPAEQKEHSEGRTSLFREGLTKGNLSLKLSAAVLSDAGRYRCSIHTDKLQKSCYVTLTVDLKAHHIIIINAVIAVIIVIITGSWTPQCLQLQAPPGPLVLKE